MITYPDGSLLLATPLDANYENVFDDYSSEDEYVQKLVDNYDYIDIDDSGKILERSFRTNGLTATIIVPINDSDLDAFNKCNYFISRKRITPQESKYTYYFITNKASRFDGDIKTYQLDLQYDVWANNYLYLKDKNIQATKIRGHITDVRKSENNDTPNKWVNICHITDEEILQTKYTIESSYGNVADDICILWARIFVDGESTFYWSGGNDGSWVQDLAGSGQIYAKNSIRCFYFPYAIVNVKTRAVENDYQVIYNDQTITMDFIKTWMPDNSHIMKIDFTFCAPNFNLVSSIQNKKITLRDVISYNVHTDVTNIRDISSGNSLTPLAIKPITDFRFDSRILESKVNFFFNSPVKNKQDAITKIIDDFSFECRAKLYPYNYYSIRTNNKVTNLYPVNECDNVEIHSYMFTQNPVYECLYNKYTRGVKEIVKANLPTSSYTNGQYETSIDSYQSFIRNNGNAINAQMIKSATQSIATKATGAIASVVTANPLPYIGASIHSSTNKLNTKFGINAQLKDADNQRDTWITTDFSALADLAYQDDIMFLLNLPENDDEYKSICYQFHRYGVNANCNESIMTTHRTNFDYAEYANISFEIPMDEKQRDMLLQIFARGFTRWHMNYQGLYNDNKLRMSITIPNLSTNYVEDLPE